MPRFTHRRHARLAAGVVVLCAVASVAAGVAASAPRYAKTVTQTGAIDPTAIPLGDGYVSTSPKVGYVDSCQTSFRAGGAEHAGSWIDTAAKTWNMSTKLAVNGKVSWPDASYAVKVVSGKRVFTFDDLPIDHTTGTFPIASTDPAYQIDRNPNQIAKQSVSWSLDATPSAASKPTCVGLGPIGVLTDGVYLYNALDAAGNDAAAHEVQDACGGHPDGSSSYHHHDVPPCITAKTANGKATLVGYALDGYGIYVVKDKNGTMPTNTDLDACHGATSTVTWNGKATRIYHYVATLEYPYTVGCFHGTPIKSARVGRSGGSGAGAGAGAGTGAGQGAGQGAGSGLPPRRRPPRP